MVEIVECEHCGKKMHKRPKPVEEKRNGQICNSCWSEIRRSVLGPEELAEERTELRESGEKIEKEMAMKKILERLRGKEDESTSAKE